MSKCPRINNLIFSIISQGYQKVEIKAGINEIKAGPRRRIHRGANRISG